MNKIISSVMLVLVSLTAFGQKEQIFAFVQNMDGKAALKAASGYKYDVANQVFNDLLRTRGDIRQQAPDFVMNNGEQYIAWMNPAKVEVGLEEKAYDVCAAMGADSLNALAALLSHEITHYYEKHDWSRNFVNANRTLDAAYQIQNLDEGLMQETQADYIGGFLSFSAGYNVYNMIPQLLPQLYASYGLPEALPGYPSLQERVKVSENAMVELLDLQTIFQTARFLTVLQNYEAAAVYYREISQTFQSREIYNNTGVNLTLAAMAYFNAAEMPYILPLELDPDSRLNSLKGIQGDRIKMREELLAQAAENFERAIGLDPDYTTAYLNRASIHALSGEWDDAEFWLRKGKKKMIRSANNADFVLLEGIIAALQQDTVKAITLLTSAKKKGSLLADINLAVLSHQASTPATYEKRVTNEELDQISVDLFLRLPSVDKEINVTPAIICGVKTLGNSHIWLHYANDGREYAVVQWTDNKTVFTQKGVGKGSPSTALEEAYGLPQRIVTETNGEIWVYQAYNLLFAIDLDGNIGAWGTYRKSDI